MNRQHMKADERRAVTVNTVIELAARQNPSDITTSAIAKHMKVTQGALFRHFPNKEAIWQAVIEWVTDRLLKKIDVAVNSTSDPLVALQAVFMAHIEFVSHHPGVPRMLFGELQRAEDTIPKKTARALLQKYGERVALLIDNGKSADKIDKNIDTASAVTLFIGSIQGLIMQSLLAGDISIMREKALGVFILFRQGIVNSME
ncbi:MAG TPA: TetR/AcrR family transcriptional regulator [Aeromonadales bacterium]|nr:TetR/AcrR family transcriptional regulator [Aeromonadales bacterium]